jgi:predicted  nucleic acid-binding Zn-ribbon protein
MGEKAFGIERFLAPSLNKIEDELRSIHAEINTVKTRMDESDKRMTKLEEEYKHFAIKMDKSDNGITTESKVLFDSISEMEKQNRDEIELLKRTIDVAQRRLFTLEAKMKDLGQ